MKRLVATVAAWFVRLLAIAGAAAIGFVIWGVATNNIPPDLRVAIGGTPFRPNLLVNSVDVRDFNDISELCSDPKTPVDPLAQVHLTNNEDFTVHGATMQVSWLYQDDGTMYAAGQLMDVSLHPLEPFLSGEDRLVSAQVGGCVPTMVKADIKILFSEKAYDQDSD